MQRLLIEENDENQRVDRFLKKVLPRAPKNLIYKSLRKKNITVNGKKGKPEDLLVKGDTVEIFFSDETFQSFGKDLASRRESWPEILYEDENLLLMAKPPGILTHSRGNYREPDMVAKMLTYLQDTGSYHPGKEHSFVPGVCNRLDRNTSGILIGTKNAEAARRINELIRKHKVEKRYLALVEGKFTVEGEVRGFLEKNEKRNKTKVGDSGKEIITRFHPLAYRNGVTLLDVNLITGRTHQIRSQCKALGHPVLGDAKYGKGKVEQLGGQWLHNYSVGFLECPFSHLEKTRFYLLPGSAFDGVGRKYFKGEWDDLLRF